MHALVEIGLGNALVAGLLALPAAAASRLGRWPALAHGLWLLVFVKLLTPVAFPVPVTWPTVGRSAETAQVDDPAPAAGTEIVADGPLWAWEIAPPDENETASESTPASLAPAVPPSIRLSWDQVLVALWAAGAVVFFGWSGLQVWRFHRL